MSNQPVELDNKQIARIADDVSRQFEAEAVHSSIIILDRCLYLLVIKGTQKRLLVSAPQAPRLEGFVGRDETVVMEDKEQPARLCECNAENAAVLRQRLSYLVPVPVGLSASIGLGDRLGLATPGHIRAVKGSGLKVFLAQQSIREMTRTERSPQQVMDDALWGVFQEGFREGFGSDADHLKTTDDIDACLAAGFTLFTFDPGDHVQTTAGLDPAELAAKFSQLPWDALQCRPADSITRYVGKCFSLDGAENLCFNEQELFGPAVKYAAAIAHVAKLYRHLASTAGDRPFEVEVSVDETDEPTSPLEHFYVVKELQRLGVAFVSLAPRFVGRFEKGVDYIGDPGQFESTFAQHAAIARTLGPYKISIHSGSDKFSVYPIAAKLARGLIHVKTAGTSYLEALRTLGRIDPGLFREILDFAHERYEEDKASYHVSADPAKLPHAADVSEEQLPGLLDDFHARQFFHVTYGSVLTTTDATGGLRFGHRLHTALQTHEADYADDLKKHLGRHVKGLKY